MYKVFVSDKPIVLTTESTDDMFVKNYQLKSVDVLDVIKVLGTKDVHEVRLIHHNQKKLLQKFLMKLPNVIAAGGKVYNTAGKVLFIYRNDKWDLPKGKIEKGESFEEGAIREVEEETGVKGLEITRPLETTYHIFKRNGKYRIKTTYWFEMETNYDGKLVPQENEGITKVKWLGAKKRLKAMENSYANIKLLM